MKAEIRPYILFIFLALAGLAVSFLLLSLDPLRESSSRDILSSGTENPPQRIICGTPGITEIVFELGAGGRVVGVSQFSTYPPDASLKPVIGGIINPNREKITTLKPDLFITQGKHESLASFCRQQGINFLSLDIETLEDIADAISLLGQKLQLSRKAATLNARMKEELSSLESRSSNLPRQKVFFVLGHSPGDLSNLMSIGSKTFLHQIIGIAGGVNIFADAPGTYPQISKETLLRRLPDVIIEVMTGPLTEDKIQMLRSDWSRLSHLPAVQDGRIFFLNQDYILIPGIRVTKSARLLASIFHPEVFNVPNE